MGASHSRTGEVSATFAHAAPEILAGEPATEASNVYSLASTLYELLSGRPPFARPIAESFTGCFSGCSTPLLVNVIRPPDEYVNNQPDPVTADQPDRGVIYLVIELAVRDGDAIRRYATEVSPMLERYGGKIIGLSTDGGDVIEGERRPVVIALHRWPNRDAFDRFYASSEYQPLKRLRHKASDTRIAVLDAVGD